MSDSPVQSPFRTHGRLRGARERILALLDIGGPDTPDTDRVFPELRRRICEFADVFAGVHCLAGSDADLDESVVREPRLARSAEQLGWKYQALQNDLRRIRRIAADAGTGDVSSAHLVAAWRRLDDAVSDLERRQNGFVQELWCADLGVPG